MVSYGMIFDIVYHDVSVYLICLAVEYILCT